MPSGIYKGNKGKVVSEETKRKISISMKGVNTWQKGRKASEETKAKLRERMLGNKYNPGIRGEKHYRWIKDRTQLKETREKAYDTKYKYWMLQVKKADKWTCRIADVNCGGRLEAHHILNWMDFPELRYEIKNGITLCHAHHPRGREREAELTPYLQSLVSKR